MCFCLNISCAIQRFRQLRYDMGDNSFRPLHVNPLGHGAATGTVQLETGYGAYPSNSSINQLSIAKVWGSAESTSIALFPMWA